MVIKFCDKCIEKGRYKSELVFFVLGLENNKTGYICNECKKELDQPSQPERRLDKD